MSSNWPAWATEPVAVRPPMPDWAGQAELLGSALSQQLSPWLVTGVHHVGSTAVPGLCAKPILDLMAGVADLAGLDPVAALLAPTGWHYVPPELDGRGWRRLFVQVTDRRRHAHLHLMDPATPRWRQQLAFRDRLRADPDLRDRYGQLKQQLAISHRADREAYSAAKTAFIAEAIGEQPHSSPAAQ